MHGCCVECWPTCMAAEWNVEEEVVEYTIRLYHRYISVISFLLSINLGKCYLITL